MGYFSLCMCNALANEHYISRLASKITCVQTHAYWVLLHGPYFQFPFARLSLLARLHCHCVKVYPYIIVWSRSLELFYGPNFTVVWPIGKVDGHHSSVMFAVLYEHFFFGFFFVLRYEFDDVLSVRPLFLVQNMPMKLESYTPS